jgi:hypothetical protein
VAANGFTFTKIQSRLDDLIASLPWPLLLAAAAAGLIEVMSKISPCADISAKTCLLSRRSHFKVAMLVATTSHRARSAASWAQKAMRVGRTRAIQ